jgi:polyisoprenoid-binding protein YceI
MSVKSFFIGILLFQILTINAQTHLKLNNQSYITINGTSNLHDWESNVTEIHLSGTAQETEGKISEINSLTITVPVKSIKSGKSIMDDKTYKALLADEHPNIKFILESAKLAGGNISGKGKLTIAGYTKEVSFQSKYTYTGKSTFEIKGSQKLDMQAYGVTPPTALMGTVSTGNELTIPYHIIINY